MLRNVELAFFFASILSLYLCLRLSAGKGKRSHWWVAMPFVLIFGFAVCAYYDDKLSLNYLLWTGFFCGVCALYLVYLYGLANSITPMEIDPSKPIVLPLPK